MKQAYLRYYDRLSPWAPLVFFKDALLARSSLRRLALTNRQRDYARLSGRPEALALHRRLNRELLRAREAWQSYDYGEGYFYQSSPALGITGLRDTEARVRAMRLRERLAGLSVLEIGCNTGFVALAVAEVARSVVGFDLNPHLVEIARAATSFLGHENCRFEEVAFEEFQTDERFDAVLSFASHRTYDGRTRQSAEDYFARCHDLLRPGGLLCFESHPPRHEGDGLEAVIEILARRLSIRERTILEYGTFLDHGRTFVVAQRASVPGDRGG